MQGSESLAIFLFFGVDFKNWYDMIYLRIKRRHTIMAKLTPEQQIIISRAWRAIEQNKDFDSTPINKTNMYELVQLSNDEELLRKKLNEKIPNRTRRFDNTLQQFSNSGSLNNIVVGVVRSYESSSASKSSVVRIALVLDIIRKMSGEIISKRIANTYGMSERQARRYIEVLNDVKNHFERINKDLISECDDEVWAI